MDIGRSPNVVYWGKKSRFSVVLRLKARDTLAAVIIRRAEAKETQAMMAVFIAAVERATEHYSVAQRAAWVRERASRTFWEHLLHHQIVMVAYELNTLCGMVALNQRGEITMIYVLPDYQRKGVGARLVQHIENHAIEEGFAHLKTHASPYLKPLLHRLGFELIEEFATEVQGQHFHHALMMKELI